MTRRPYSSALPWLAGILILASGCMDQSPTAVLLDPATVTPGQAQFQANVRPVFSAAPFAAGTHTALITPAGGSIDFGIGSIDFPKGAVQRATHISATVDGSTISVEFAPHLVFSDAQPTLCFATAGVALPANVSVIHVKDDGSSSAIPFEVSGSNYCVSPNSFSKFILAAE